MNHDKWSGVGYDCLFLPEVVGMQLQCQFVWLLERCVAWIATRAVRATLKEILSRTIVIYVTPTGCKIACNIDPLRGAFASNSDPL